MDEGGTKGCHCAGLAGRDDLEFWGQGCEGFIAGERMSNGRMCSIDTFPLAYGALVRSREISVLW